MWTNEGFRSGGVPSRPAAGGRRDCPVAGRDLAIRSSGYHSSVGSSWKTLRVPAIHCCLSDSK